MNQNFATEKQISIINKLKIFVDDKDDGNIIDNIDLTKVSRYDASLIIEGLLGLKNENRRLWNGWKLSSRLDYWLDNVYDTCEKYLC